MNDNCPTRKMMEKSAETGEPMWRAYGERVPEPVTFKEIQSYTEYEFDKLPKKRKDKIYQFLLKREIEKIWKRFCLLTFIGVPLLLFISTAHYIAIPFLFYTLVYIVYIAHKAGYLEGYDKGYDDLRSRGVYSPEGIKLKEMPKPKPRLMLRKKALANPKLIRFRELVKKKHLALLRLGMGEEEKTRR